MGQAVASVTPRLVAADPLTWLDQVGPLCLTFYGTLWKSCAHGTLLPENRASVGHAGQSLPPCYHPQANRTRLLYCTFYCQVHLCLVLSTLVQFISFSELGPQNSGLLG